MFSHYATSFALRCNHNNGWDAETTLENKNEMGSIQYKHWEWRQRWSIICTSTSSDDKRNYKAKPYPYKHLLATKSKEIRYPYKHLQWRQNRMHHWLSKVSEVAAVAAVGNSSFSSQREWYNDWFWASFFFNFCRFDWFDLIWFFC